MRTLLKKTWFRASLLAVVLLLGLGLLVTHWFSRGTDYYVLEGAKLAGTVEGVKPADLLDALGLAEAEEECTVYGPLCVSRYWSIGLGEELHFTLPVFSVDLQDLRPGSTAAWGTACTLYTACLQNGAWTNCGRTALLDQCRVDCSADGNVALTEGSPSLDWQGRGKSEKEITWTSAAVGENRDLWMRASVQQDDQPPGPVNVRLLWDVRVTLDGRELGTFHSVPVTGTCQAKSWG